jgi:hypothetical protein
MLNLSKPDYRMRDVEIVVRYFANKYFLKSYEGNLKKAFDNTVKLLNEKWKTDQDKIVADATNLNSAILFSIDLFGGQRQAFSKWLGNSFQNNFNRAIFDIMVYYFSVPAVLAEAEGKKVEILDAFKSLCTNDRSEGVV